MMSPTLSSSGIAIVEMKSRSRRWSSRLHNNRAQFADPSGRNHTRAICDFLHGWREAFFFFDRCHCDIRDATRCDVIEWREIAANIQRKAVHRDPMPHANTNRRDFAILNPDPGQAVARRFTEGKVSR